MDLVSIYLHLSLQKSMKLCNKVMISKKTTVFQRTKNFTTTIKKYSTLRKEDDDDQNTFQHFEISLQCYLACDLHNEVAKNLSIMNVTSSIILFIPLWAHEVFLIRLL